MAELPLDERILKVLSDSATPMTPQQIAHLSGFPRPNNQAAHVNATLYTLLEADRIERHTLSGLKPTYTLMLTPKQ